MKGLGLRTGRLGDRKGFLIAIIAALLIPLVYAVIILTADWGPYDNLDSLPVAVVNNDVGGMSGEEEINVGDDLVADLKESKTLGWDFVDSKEAERGMKNNEYYMVIEIPKDFSQKVTTVMDENPEKPELKFTQNEGLHFMAAQVTNNATERIRSQLADKITETYTENVFNSLGDVATGFQDGADGAGKINEGATQLHDGTGQIVSSLKEKAPDIDRLAAGSKELKAGTNTMHNSLVAKQADIARLADGANQVNDGANTILTSLEAKSGDISRLADGTQKLEDGSGLLLKSLKGGSGDIGKLAAGAQDLAIGANDLHAGTKLFLNRLEAAKNGDGTAENPGLNNAFNQLSAGSQGLKEGIDTFANEAPALRRASNTVTDKLQEMLAADPTLQTNATFMTALGNSTAVSNGINELVTNPEKLPMLQGGATALNAGINEAGTKIRTLVDASIAGLKGQPGQTGLVEGAEKVATGANQIAAGNASVNSSWGKVTNSVATINGGISEVNAGNQTVESGWNTLTNGVGQLAGGSKQVADGNQTVKSGWNELTAGAGKIDNGMTQVSDGTQTVKTGWGTLTDGVTKVDDGVGKIESGSKELSTGLAGGAEETGNINTGDNNISQFASPVQLAGETLNKFPEYRYANAPYIISLALFVGVLILSLLFDLVKPAVTAVSPFRWYLGKYGTMAGLATAQALIVSFFASFFLKSNIVNSVMLVLFSLFVSLTFMTIVFFLVALAGNIGRFIAFAFLVLQLSTTGSALPIHMLPDNLQALSKFLPLTYSIGGFKSIITLDHYGAFWANVGALFVFLAVFAGLTLAYVLFRSNKRVNQTEAAA